MAFQKSFDELLNQILTDYRNQFPEADTSQGSMIFIKSACLASALWGLYKYQNWISNQIFPDTAESEFMEHHAWIRGITRRAGESDEALLARLLDFIGRPPAGGNKSDYEKWALSVDYVHAAWCFPAAQGPGTVDVLITADTEHTGDELPTDHALSGTVTALAENKLIDSAAQFSGTVRPGDRAINPVSGLEAEVLAVVSDTELTLDADIYTALGQDYDLKSLTAQVKDYIDKVRPVTAHLLRVLAPSRYPVDVTMTVEGDANKAQIALEVQAYMNSLAPGEYLRVHQLIAIAITNGATRVSSMIPAADVEATEYQMIRPGTITIN